MKNKNSLYMATVFIATSAVSFLMVRYLTRREPEAERRDIVDEASMESFPASDAPPWR